MIIDTETIKGIFYAGGGLTISEIQILEGWVGLAIKIVAFAVIVFHLFRTINKHRKETTMLDNGDNESGQGSELDPEDDD